MIISENPTFGSRISAMCAISPFMSLYDCIDIDRWKTVINTHLGTKPDIIPFHPTISCYPAKSQSCSTPGPMKILYREREPLDVLFLRRYRERDKHTFPALWLRPISTTRNTFEIQKYYVCLCGMWFACLPMCVWVCVCGNVCVFGVGCLYLCECIRLHAHFILYTCLGGWNPPLCVCGGLKVHHLYVLEVVHHPIQRIVLELLTPSTTGRGARWLAQHLKPIISLRNKCKMWNIFNIFAL